MGKNYLKEVVKQFPLTIFCVVLIWYLSLFRPPRVRELESIFGFDKWVHICMYLGTCCVLWMEYFRARCQWSIAKRTLIAVIAPICMSGIIELAQEYFTTYRTGDWTDFAANSFGVLLALALSPLEKRIFYRHKN